MNVKTWYVNGIALAVVWVFVRAVPFDAAAVAGEFLIGLAVGLPTAFVFRRLYNTDVNASRMLRAAPYAVLYVVLFIRELVVANVDVALRVILPWRTLDPAVIVLPLRVDTDLAVTTIANSITLTPGTLTMEHIDDENALIVHSIDGSDPDAVVAPIRRWENLALVIFDEQLKPGDPAPAATRVVHDYGGDDDE